MADPTATSGPPFHTDLGGPGARPHRRRARFRGLAGRVTQKGHGFVLALTLLAVLGIDTRRTGVYVVLSLLPGWLVACLVLTLPRPRDAHLSVRWPRRLTVGVPHRLPVQVSRLASCTDPRGLAVLFAQGWVPQRFRAYRPVRVDPVELFANPDAGTTVVMETTVHPERRGRFDLTLLEGKVDGALPLENLESIEVPAEKVAEVQSWALPESIVKRVKALEPTPVASAEKKSP